MELSTLHSRDVTDEQETTGKPGLAGESAVRHEIGPALSGRWRSLPPRIRLQDTIATQETPPKPQVIAEVEDPLREATMYPI